MAESANKEHACALWGQAFSLPPGFRPALLGLDEG
jgi:hypothetical protein